MARSGSSSSNVGCSALTGPSSGVDDSTDDGPRASPLAPTSARPSSAADWKRTEGSFSRRASLDDRARAALSETIRTLVARTLGEKLAHGVRDLDEDARGTASEVRDLAREAFEEHVMPIAYTSVRASTSRPQSCSGAMYSGVPTTSCARVSLPSCSSS